MKKLFFLTAFALATLLANAQNSTDEGVEINGVTWATRNVNTPGTFADKPEDDGRWYQWNRKVAWSTTDATAEDWDETMPEGLIWEKENDPAPKGWRVPTDAEIEKLLDKSKVTYEWTIQNGVKGGKFTDKVTGASIFLRAAGCRTKFGTAFGTDVLGFYWSSTQASDRFAEQLNFYDGVADGFFVQGRGYGQSLRPVADETDTSMETIYGGKPEVAGYYGIMGMQLNEEPESGIYIILYNNGQTKKMIK